MLKHFQFRFIEKDSLHRYKCVFSRFRKQLGFCRFIRNVVCNFGQRMRHLPAALFVEQLGSYQLLSVTKQVYSSSSKQDFCKQLAETLISIRAGKSGNSHIFTVNIVTTSGLAVTLNYPAGAPSAVTGHVANNHCVSPPLSYHIYRFHFTKYSPSLQS